MPRTPSRHARRIGPDGVREHDTDGTSCWCDPRVTVSCDACGDDDDAAASCWKCGGDKVVDAMPGDAGPFVVIHRDVAGLSGEPGDPVDA
jgi:hypothetical protein